MRWCARARRKLRGDAGGLAAASPSLPEQVMREKKAIDEAEIAREIGALFRRTGIGRRTDQIVLACTHFSAHPADKDRAPFPLGGWALSTRPRRYCAPPRYA